MARTVPSESWRFGLRLRNMYIAAMRRSWIALAIAAVLACYAARAEDVSARVKKALERSTLDQPGTKPFHLKAALAPSLDRDKDSGRTGEVEIWWVDPGKWRWELRSPEFHQIEIVDGTQDWQKNDGNYLPEWLREIAVALVRPVPDVLGLARHLRDAEVKRLGGTTYCSWATMGTDGTVSKGIGGSFAITDATGLEFYGGDVGWDGLYHDYADFHGRMVARTVSSGSPEVTAKVTVLEDLGTMPTGFFNAQAPGGDAAHLATKAVPESALRKNLLPVGAPVWPPLADGPLDGVSIAKVVVDREGKVRDVGTIVTDNPGVKDAVSAFIRAMRFTPYTVDGVAVQVVSTITMPFHAVRPAGSEHFETAKTYFDRARSAGFPAAGASAPYLLRAEFTARASSGTIDKGNYTDTWLSKSQWRREAVLGNSRFVRSRNGRKWYRVAEGPDAALLQLVMTEIEPIPATESFTESDWRIGRDELDGKSAIQVARGDESPDGTPGPTAFNAYWFDETGQLVKFYFNGLETRRSSFAAFNDVQVARRVEVLLKGTVAIRIDVTGIEPAGQVDPHIFAIKGRGWDHAFTSEVR